VHAGNVSSTVTSHLPSPLQIGSVSQTSLAAVQKTAKSKIRLWKNYWKLRNFAERQWCKEENSKTNRICIKMALAEAFVMSVLCRRTVRFGVITPNPICLHVKCKTRWTKRTVCYIVAQLSLDDAVNTLLMLHSDWSLNYEVYLPAKCCYITYDTAFVGYIINCHGRKCCTTTLQSKM